MSPKLHYYLAEAERVAALADDISDPLTRSTLRQAAKSWRLLAELEAAVVSQCDPRDAPR